MEEEKEGEREEGGKRAAGKPLDAGRKEKERKKGGKGGGRKRGSGKTAGRREEEGRREGDWGGEQEKSAPSGERWGGFVNCGGIRGDYLRSTFLPFLMTMPL